VPPATSKRAGQEQQGRSAVAMPNLPRLKKPCRICKGKAMNLMQFKTPEQRSASAKKAHATRKANKEWLEKKRQDALIYSESLKIQIVALETRLAELNAFEKMSVVSAALTNKILLDGEQIAKLALPWEKSSGVYFLVQGEEVVYVGQSVNIYSRIAQHPDKKFDKYAFVPCEVKLLDKLESLYIHTLKPRLNGNVTKLEKTAPISFDKLLSL
jgi:hypothetical protein